MFYALFLSLRQRLQYSVMHDHAISETDCGTPLIPDADFTNTIFCENRC